MGQQQAWGSSPASPPELQLLGRWESEHQPNKDARLREGRNAVAQIQPAAITKPLQKYQPSVHYLECPSMTHGSLGKTGDEAIQVDDVSATHRSFQNPTGSLVMPNTDGTASCLTGMFTHDSFHKVFGTSEVTYPPAYLDTPILATKPTVQYLATFVRSTSSLSQGSNLSHYKSIFRCWSVPQNIGHVSQEPLALILKTSWN